MLNIQLITGKLTNSGVLISKFKASKTKRPDIFGFENHPKGVCYKEIGSTVTIPLHPGGPKKDCVERP